jgi:O-antigen biosynthesis protein WbqP
MIRFLDIAIAGLGLILVSPVLLACCLLVSLTSPGRPIFSQPRVGKNRRLFTCYKLRTMRSGTASAATHEVSPSAVTPVGAFLRRTKLDELPQLWNVVVGDMSLVGPRPCLPSQAELIGARDKHGIYALRPGITGPAQVQGVDMSNPERLAQLDATWLHERSLFTYLMLIVLTVRGRGRGDRVHAA